MAFQTIFKRYELKYILSKEQKDIICEAIKPYMKIDNYGRTVIRNIYFDTDTYRLIRRSIEKPAYKEKLRIRSYGQATQDSIVFVELKKKYKSVVYKRRIALPEREVTDWLCKGQSPKKQTQITKEIDYFLKYYETLHPALFLSYEREAYYTYDESDFRITFDENILCRQSDLSLLCDVGGEPILPEGSVLMEIKCSGGIPLWMTKVLSKEHIYRTPFSKYGTAYRNIIFPKIKGENTHA